jgi:hypothetical protein
MGGQSAHLQQYAGKLRILQPHSICFGPEIEKRGELLSHGVLRQSSRRHPIYHETLNGDRREAIVRKE